MGSAPALTRHDVGQPSDESPEAPHPPDSVDRRVVLITGASSGIGRATALRLAATGARLALAARSRDALEEVAAACVERGGEALVVPTDVGDPAAVDALVGAVLDTYGRLDACVHAAAVVAYGTVVDIPQDVFDRVVQTNLLGTANVGRAVLKVFRARSHGTLVIVGSILGKISTPYLGPYLASKAGVEALARVLLIEQRDLPGVAVCVVSPGSVRTPIFRQAANYAGRYGRPPEPIVDPDRVARRIAARLDHPRPRSNVGPANLLMVAGATLTPRLYDVLVGPLMRRLGLSRTPVGPTEGNVFRPVPAAEATRAAPLGPAIGLPSPGYRRRMSLNRRAMHCTPDAVFSVLSDGWLYTNWVVGASRMRNVDDHWPAVGSELHHSVGTWPLLVDDTTTVLEVDPPRLLRLQARAWPGGEAEVVVTIEPTPAGCTVTIEEQASAGPAKLIPTPLENLLLRWRNREALQRLAMIAEGRTAVDPTHGVDVGETAR
jgi:NAD(P)-dependent dehydrogenase (short-subunit alcohol dehydrogenase family)